MKPIIISEKFRPFSQQPGISVPYPLLKLVFVIYPTQIKILDWKKKQKTLLTIDFNFKSPCKSFSVFSDLLKQEIEIHCHLEDNFAKMKLALDEKKQCFYLTLLRYKEERLGFEVKRPSRTSILNRQLTKKKPLVLFKDLNFSIVKKPELLFLGSHKKQEIEKIFQRKDLREFLPLWYLWGQFCKVQSKAEKKDGTLVFLNELTETIEQKKHDKIGSILKNMMATSFAPMMVPHLEDFRHWGFHLPKDDTSKASPWLLFSELYTVIRKFFVCYENSNLYLLPHLPPELFCGKLRQVQEGDLMLHLEWTKKTIRRMMITSSKSSTITLHFAAGIKTFRLRIGEQDRGTRFKNHHEITIKRNKVYFFDNFEK